MNFKEGIDKIPVAWPDRKCVSCEALVNEVKLLHEIIDNLREKLHYAEYELNDVRCRMVR